MDYVIHADRTAPADIGGGFALWGYRAIIGVMIAKDKMMSDEIEFEYLPLSQLIAYPKNPKEHDIGQLSTTINSVIGYATPIVIDMTTGYIGAGHGRLEALMLLYQQNPKKPPKRIKVGAGGEWLVPVNKLSFKDEAELQAFILADNKLTELGGWDEPMLADLLQEVANDEAGLMELTGFDGDDLGDLLGQLTSNEDLENHSDEQVKENFMILITCTSEQNQLELFNRFESEGITCRLLIS